MQLPYFFEENIPDSGNFNLNELSSRHIVQVLRMQEGYPINITNGNGILVTCKIADANKKHCQVEINDYQTILPTTRKISIAISPIKHNNRFEWFLEKATEIGISEIIPVICSRTEKTHLKRDRLNQIIVSAMLQSQQSWMPQLTEPVYFEDLIKSTIPGIRLIAHCVDSDKKHLSSFVQSEQPKLVLIGPEGDFTEKEISAALENNFKPVNLGETRLRTETAGIVAAVLLKNYVKEEK